MKDLNLPAQEADVERESFDKQYGEKAVGLAFNPSGDSDVHATKQLYADVINKLNAIRYESKGREQRRLCSIAITEAQTAQMWAVKAITWTDSQAN